MPWKPWKSSTQLDIKTKIPYWQEPWKSGTGWIAEGCDSKGEHCVFGNTAAQNSLFEWTFEPMPASWKGLGEGAQLQVTYDVSNVNSYTQASLRPVVLLLVRPYDRSASRPRPGCCDAERHWHGRLSASRHITFGRGTQTAGPPSVSTT